MITVKEIFSNLQGLNPSTSTVSSIGTFVTAQNQQIADAQLTKVLRSVPQESLAYKILTDVKIKTFTAKQLWVVAFELNNNNDFKVELEKEREDLAYHIEYEKAKKSIKRAAKREFKSEVRKSISITESNNSDVKQSDTVLHSRFGKGTVISNDGKIITINFEEVGEKRMISDYTKLEIIK